MLVLDSDIRMEKVIEQAQIAVALGKGWKCKFVRSGQSWLKYERDGKITAVCTIRRDKKPGEWVWFQLRAVMGGEQMARILDVPHVLILSTDDGILYNHAMLDNLASRVRIEDKVLGPESFAGFTQADFKPAKDKP